MSVDLFPFAATIVLEIENAYSNQANDPGGETKWGTARSAHPEISDAQWAVWTKDDSAALFRSKYWDAHRCGEMPWPWALAVFDGEINQGSVIGLAQASLGLKIDGVIGDISLKAMRASSDESFQIFLALRLLQYTHASAFQTDGKGWFKRVIGIAMHAATTPTA